ncbi:MAG TPA: hypothetical protein VFB60_23820 [Ktedonobacteraceae bacterium]|nr:hypothetical protein [Ktedonobacteraceae bacterium]
MVGITAQQVVKVVAPERGVAQTDTDFVDGAVSGYFTYFDEHAGKRLSDAEVHAFMQQALQDNKHSNSWTAGYIVGFCEGLIADRDIFASVK